MFDQYVRYRPIYAISMDLWIFGPLGCPTFVTVGEERGG